MNSPGAAFHGRISGRVQGVGFRYSARREALRLGLTGWVRNAEDGSVEIEAEGDEDGLAAFKAWLQAGPPGARVDSLVLRRNVASGAYPSFTVEY